MSTLSLGIEEIKELLPHRKPMLLIESMSNIIKMSSATGHIKVTKNKFFLMDTFLDNQYFQVF